MASLMPLTIKKEDDIRPSIIPKRKAALVNIPPRARFAKARPNIGGMVSKAAKETKPSETEKKNAVVKEDKDNETKEKSQLLNTDSTSVIANSQASESESIIPGIKTLKKEPEILQRPAALPKRTLATPAAPRARYQKARPNIAALANKAPKSGGVQRDSGRVSANEKESITDSSELKTSNTLVDESVIQNLCREKPVRNVEPVKGFSFSRGEIEVFPEESSEESINLPNDVLQQKDVNQHQASFEFQESSLAGTLPFANETETRVTYTVLNLEEEEESFETAALQQEKKKSDCVKDLPKIMTKSQPETTKEMPLPTPVVNKVMEYPTLKSILNSPRKRATTKKAHERKRRLANLSETPSRSEMTMTDLIYYNPTGEPMKVSKPQTCAVENLPADENTKPVEPEPEEDDGSNPPVPKVIINENGEIIIDESSLVVRRKETIDTSIEAIIENDYTTYSSFRKKSSRQWTNKETSKFYKALSLVGTDFALMENIFIVKGKVTRSRRELKLKFKREEKLRLELVHKAIYETQTFDISILEDDPDEITAEEVDEPPETPVVKKRGRKPKAGNEKKPTAQKKKKKVVAIESSTDENDNAVIVLNDDSCSIYSEANSDIPEQDLSKDSTSQLTDIIRPQRKRKTKVLHDYVTDVDDSEASDGYVADSEIITRKKPPDCSENTDDNGKSLPVEKPAKVRKRKNNPVLPTEHFESFDAQDISSSPSKLKCVAISRLGRVRRAKILADFITDEDVLEEANDSSDDESVKGIGKKRKVQAFDEDSNEEGSVEKGNCIMVEHIDCLPDTATVEVIEKAKEDYEESPELVMQEKDTENSQDIVFVAAINSPRAQDSTDPTNLRAMQSPTESLIDYINAQHSSHKKSPAQEKLNSNKKVSSNVKSPKLLTMDKHTVLENYRKNCDIQMKCLGLQQTNECVLANSVVSEVVITGSTKMKRTRRRAAAPNVGRGKPQKRVEVKMPHVQPSFSNFTPAEEQSSPTKEIKTYSRNINRQAGLPSQVGHTVSTDPDTSIENSQLIDDQGTSFQNNQMIHDPRTFQNNHTTNDPRNFQNNHTTNYPRTFQNNHTTNDPGTILDNNQMILDTTNPSLYNHTILDPTSSFPNSQAITLDTCSTDPPVMIFTKSPNNENILHLFMVSPQHSY